MVYNSRQLLYRQKSHNTGNSGGWVYIFPGSNANVSSEGRLPRFGSYCTYTRNEILEKKIKKKMLICWQLVIKSASIPHHKIAEKTA